MKPTEQKQDNLIYIGDPKKNRSRAPWAREIENQLRECGQLILIGDSGPIHA